MLEFTPDGLIFKACDDPPDYSPEETSIKKLFPIHSFPRSKNCKITNLPINDLIEELENNDEQYHMKIDANQTYKLYFSTTNLLDTAKRGERIYELNNIITNLT